MTSAQGPVEERVLDDLTVQWRAQINRALRGTGAAVIGDYIVTSAHDPERGLEQQVGPDERLVGNIVYQTVLPASQVAQAKLAGMDPRLTVISTMGIER